MEDDARCTRRARRTSQAVYPDDARLSVSIGSRRMGLIRRLLAGAATRVSAKAVEYAGESSHSTVETVQRLVGASRLGEALRVVHAAVADHPDDMQLLSTRGSVLFELGRTWEARRDLLRAEALGQRDAGLNLQLGWLELWAGSVDDAEWRMRGAVRERD